MIAGVDPVTRRPVGAAESTGAQRSWWDEAADLLRRTPLVSTTLPLLGPSDLTDALKKSVKKSNRTVAMIKNPPAQAATEGGR